MKKNNKATRDYSIKRVWRKLMITLSTTSFIPFTIRFKLLKLGG